jgi:hypothetical protein
VRGFSQIRGRGPLVDNKPVRFWVSRIGEEGMRRQKRQDDAPHYPEP